VAKSGILLWRKWDYLNRNLNVAGAKKNPRQLRRCPGRLACLALRDRFLGGLPRGRIGEPNDIKGLPCCWRRMRQAG